jgi:hypothetical protein
MGDMWKKDNKVFQTWEEMWPSFPWRRQNTITGYT